MVDRVGKGPVYGYPQVSEKKINTNSNGVGEKFQLDYGKEGAIYEPSSEALKKQQAEKSATTKTQEPSKTEVDGVRLTLSGNATERAETAENEGAGASSGTLEKLTRIVNRVVGAIKSFISSIWNDEPKADESGKASEQTEIDMIPDEMKTEKSKTQFEKAKEEAEVFLASAEGKKVARSSDLLTYYDKHGTVISVSPSDRQRILYGDKNQIEV